MATNNILTPSNLVSTALATPDSLEEQFSVLSDEDLANQLDALQTKLIVARTVAEKRIQKMRDPFKNRVINDSPQMTFKAGHGGLTIGAAPILVDPGATNTTYWTLKTGIGTGGNY